VYATRVALPVVAGSEMMKADHAYSPQPLTAAHPKDSATQWAPEWAMEIVLNSAQQDFTLHP